MTVGSSTGPGSRLARPGPELRRHCRRRDRAGVVPGDVTAFVVLVLCGTAALAVHLTGVLNPAHTTAHQALVDGVARALVAQAQYRLINDGQAPYRVLEGTDSTPSSGRDMKAFFDGLAILDKKVASENDGERSPAFTFFGNARANGKWQGLTGEDGELFTALSGLTVQLRVQTKGLDSDVLGQDDRTLGQVRAVLSWSDNGVAHEHSLVQVVRSPAEVEP